MNHVNHALPEQDQVIQIGDLRATVEQIVRAELVVETYAIVQVRVGEQVFTRSLRGDDVSTFMTSLRQMDVSEAAPLEGIFVAMRLEEARARVSAAHAALAEARKSVERLPLGSRRVRLSDG